MVSKKPLTYLVVRLSDLRELSGNEVLFLAYLKQVSKAKPKKSGYFELDSGYIGKTLCLDRRQVARMREKLVKAGRIAYIPGKNQNDKPRWKLL